MQGFLFLIKTISWTTPYPLHIEGKSCPPGQSSVCPLDLPLPFTPDSILGHLGILLLPQETGGTMCPKLQQSPVSGEAEGEKSGPLTGSAGTAGRLGRASGWLLSQVSLHGHLWMTWVLVPGSSAWPFKSQ